MFAANYEKDTTQNYMSNLKVVISGTKLEFYDFTHPIFFGRKVPKNDYDDNGNKIEKIPIVLSKEEKLLSSARRAKKNIHRLICANAWQWKNDNDKPYMPITLTLTFADDIRDIKVANDLFSNFIQRLNYSVNKNERGHSEKEAKKNLLKYTAVIEFQDKTRGGVIHYHMIFYNLPRMNRIYDRLFKIWGKGYFLVGSSKKKGRGKSHIQNNKQLDKVAEYFTKYISKGFEDDRLAGKKKYFNSRGLIKPVEVFIEELVHMIKNHVPDESLDFAKENLTYKYKLGERSFNYKRYDLSEFPEVLKEVIEIANLYA